MVLSASLWSHPTEVCLERVADSAELLKVCNLNQRHAGECDRQKTNLQGRIEECRLAQFTEKAISDAVKVGDERIEGSVMGSPYQQRLQQQRATNRSVKPNVEAFGMYFPDMAIPGSELKEHFDTEKCPNRYEGVENRWNLAKVRAVNRFPLDKVVKGAGFGDLLSYPLFFLERQIKGRCYSGQEAGKEEARNLVVSIPDQSYREILSDDAKRVLICEDLLCTNDAKALESLYQDYLEQYQEFVHLAECFEIEKRNQTRLRAKSQRRIAEMVPGRCPGKRVDMDLERAQSRLKALDQGLFGAETVQLISSKSL